MAESSVRWGATVNIGDYESLSVQIELPASTTHEVMQQELKRQFYFLAISALNRRTQFSLPVSCDATEKLNALLSWCTRQ